MDWRDPEWLKVAQTWIRGHAPGSLTDPIEQPHIYPWATVLRVPTSDGVIWFKANAPIQRFEAALTEELVKAAPEVTVELVAVDLERGWLLMRDAGSRLRELVTGAEQIEHWLEILPQYAELQLSLAPRVERFLTIGVPDERLAGLAARLGRVLADDETLFLGRLACLALDELSRLRAAVPTVASMCLELAAVGIPETIQHDDFHDGQVFIRDGRYRFLELASPAELRAAFDLAHRTGTIGRALAWHRYFVGDPDAERDDTVAYGLKMFLANGPVGNLEP